MSNLLEEKALEAARKQTREKLKPMVDAFIQIAKENQMKKEVDCKNTYNPVCPYCGFIYKSEIYKLGIDEFEDTEIECDNCGKSFMVWIETVTMYSSSTMEEYNE